MAKSHFDEDGTQSFMVFQTINKYLKVITNTDYVSSWKSKRLSSESSRLPKTSDNSLTPALSYYGTKTRVKFTGSCLKQPRISYTHGKVVSIYIVYELGASSSHINDSTLRNCLFSAVTLTKNADIDKYGYSGFGNGPTQGLEHTLTAENMYSINFTVTKKKFCLSLHCNGANSYLFVNGTEIYKFKAKDSEIVASPLCLGNILKDWSTDNMKKDRV